MSIGSRIPSNASDRRKFFIAIGLIVACVGWLSYYALQTRSGYREAKSPDTPGWRIAYDVNAKLIEDHALSDVGVSVAQETPLKLTVNGAVYKQADLDRLPEVLKTLAPNAEFDMHVDLMRH